MYIRYAQQLKCTKMNTELKGLCKFVLFPVDFFAYNGSVQRSGRHLSMIASSLIVLSGGFFPL